MDKKWLLGFIEGTGCFSVIIRKSNNQVGYQTTADFTIKLPLSQAGLLEEIHSFLGIGRLYESKGEVMIKATRLEDVKKLVKFLGKSSFISESKKKEFSIWKECVSLMDRRVHLTREGILEIARLRDSIHTKNLWNKKNYCSLRVEIDPCQVYQKEHELPQGCRICWSGEGVQLPQEVSR